MEGGGGDEGKSLIHLVSEVCTEGEVLFAVVQHYVLAGLAVGLVIRAGLH